LPASGDHIFASIDTVFAPVGIDFLGGLIVKVKIFPLLNPQKPQVFDPFLDLEIFAQNALQ